MSNVFTTGAMEVRQPDGTFKSTHVLIGNTKESIDAVNAAKKEAIEEINRVKETIPEDYSSLDESLGKLEELQTVDKSNLVKAINEVNGKVGQGGSGGSVNITVDNHTLIFGGE